MIEQQSSYRSIFKANSLFGGVQVVNIIITVIRGKAVAVLLGTSGMGLNALFLSTLRIITESTNLGLPQSAVKFIAEANGTGDEAQVSWIVSIFKKWIWMTGILGMTVTLLLSHLLSKWTFGSDEYTFSFFFLSVTFIFGALNAGIYTVLRGLRKLKLLAKANIFGHAGGLLVSLPLFYLYGKDGIVPAIIVSTIAMFLISLYFRKKVRVKLVRQSLGEIWNGGLEMGKLGLAMTVKMLFTSLSIYLLSVYIVRVGSLSDLGLYNAGNTILQGYVGMIFTAMSTDYFPRLSEVINLDIQKWQKTVNQQAELVLLILGPILLGILITAPFLIRILLTSEFLASLIFIQIAIPSILMKAITWCLGYIYLAKGAKKIFLTTELIANIILLAANIGGYYFYGIAGLGIAQLVSFSLFATVHYLIVNRIYKFAFTFNLILIFSFQFICCIAGLIMSLLLDYNKLIIYILPIIIGNTVYSIYHINKRIGLINYIKSLNKKS